MAYVRHCGYYNSDLPESQPADAILARLHDRDGFQGRVFQEPVAIDSRRALSLWTE